MAALAPRRVQAHLASLALGLLTSLPALAQAPADEAGAKPDQEGKPPAYRGSSASWEHNVSAQTLGVGDDPQSANPTYTMGFAVRPRYYLLDNPRSRLSLRGDAGIYREFTNSDSTTQRGEWSLSDTELVLVYVRRLLGANDGDALLGEIRPLSLLLPTSEASFESGRYFGLGATLGITKTSPLLQGRFKPDLSSVVRFAVGYRRWFARATVPTNPSLERVRLTPDGRSLPGDQLSGASLIRDELTLSARFQLAFGEAVSWTTDFGFQPAWKYDVADEVEICGVVATGCTTVGVGEDDSRYLVRTQFNTELGFRLYTGLSLEVGYGSAANQLGADGRRRGIFYNPDAGFYASLTFTPDELLSPPKKRSAQGPGTSHSF
jgi:hypothetical protein